MLKQCKILGLLTREPELFFDEQRKLKLKSTGLKEDELNELINLRHKARLAKDFAEADRLRKDLELKRIHLEDFPQGTKWRVRI